MVTYDSSTNVFSIAQGATSDLGSAGIYSVVVTGTLASPAPASNTATASFSITLVDPCPNSTITIGAVSAQTQKVSATAGSVTVSISDSVTVCGSPSYTITDDADATLNADIFTVSAKVISFSTTNESLVGVYPVKVHAYYSTTGYPSKDLTFNVTVEVDCTLNTITASSVTDQSHTIGASATTYTITAFT